MSRKSAHKPSRSSDIHRRHYENRHHRPDAHTLSDDWFNTMCSSLRWNCDRTSFDSSATRPMYDDRDTRVRHVKCTTPRTPRLEYEDEEELSQMTEFTPVTPPMISQQVSHAITHEQNSVISSNSLSPSHSLTSSTSSTNRIIAPNVSKLSPSSVVAVKIKSPHEEVTVMCAVDVLKMRSGYFLQHLERQERSRNVALTSLPVTATVQSPPQQHSESISASQLWRERLETEDSSPFEAAAFLESLHESRAAYAGEWNQCWARLSVMWSVDDVAEDFSRQIDHHLTHLISSVRDHHWRVNPSIYAGMRVAAIRKGNTATPTIISGTVVEASPSPTYSKVRVAFDECYDAPPYTPPPPPPRESSQLAQPACSANMHSNAASTRPTSTTPTPKKPNNARGTHVLVGEVGEPFWIQGKGDIWYEPDELFALGAKKIITETDRKILWEMISVLIDCPSIGGAMKSGLGNVKDLVYILRKTEFRILWSPEAANYLPKDLLAELICDAYVGIDTA